MAEDLLETVGALLKDEKWTRMATEGYNDDCVTQLQSIVQKARDGELQKEVREVCEEALTHDKDCVPALYISGMLTLDGNALDMAHLNDLIGIFQRLHKNDLVKQVCQEVLKTNEDNKSALRTLAGCYKEEKSGQMWPVMERLVRLDNTEANLARTLGEHYEESNDEDAFERAADYYKTALSRYVKNRSTQNAKEVWRHLVNFIPEDLDYFSRTKRDAAKCLSPAIAGTLMLDLYKHYRDVENYDVCIALVKQVLQLLPDDAEARRELLDCYRKKYSGVEKLDDYLRASNLIGNFRNVFEAIGDFEKHIAFKESTFVYHKTWGVGKIISIKGYTLHINFGKRRGTDKPEVHDLTLQSAVNILTPLGKNHFWVKRATMTHDALKTYVKSNPEAALKDLVASFDNKCDMKRIKAELVPAVLTPNEWAAWHSAAKKILETSADFGVDPNNAMAYTVTNGGTTASGKIADEFKAQKQFMDRVETMMKYVNNPDTKKDGEDLPEMMQYFLGFLKPNTTAAAAVSEHSKAMLNAVVSYLALAEAARITGVNLAQYGTFPLFEQVYHYIQRPRELYTLLRDTPSLELRRLFAAALHAVNGWEDEYLKLLSTAAGDKAVAAYMVSCLVEAGRAADLTALVRKCVDAWKDNRYAVIFFARDCAKEPWFIDAGIGQDKLFIALINIVSITFREIDNHLNTTENKKINRAATALLFKGEGKDCPIVTYMLANGPDACRRMFTLVNDIAQLDPSYKPLLRRRILETYKDFVFPTAGGKTKASQDVMYVTAKKLEEKKARAEALTTVELPRVAVEIAEARAQGDLKENAEYKSAREAQSKLQQELSLLNAAIAKAVVFDPAAATSAVVSFSTEVTLHNTKTGEDEVMKLFGPWESDPDKGIISYVSPLGMALMDKKVGEAAGKVRDHDFGYYTVKAIKTTRI